MNIVKLNVYAEAYYSGATYEEDVVISKSLYEKIKTELDEYDSENNENARGVYVGELDGKHSEVEGDLSVEVYSEEEIADCSWDLCDLWVNPAPYLFLWNKRALWKYI